MFTLFIVLSFIFILLRNLKRLFISNHAVNIKYSSTNTPKATLLIAHPDDEIMFFCPLLLSRAVTSIICLSNGNFRNLGKIREKEIRKVSQLLNVKLYIGPFKDNNDWDPPRLIKYLNKVCAKERFTVIYTFDELGVSEHKNHISCFKVAELFIREKNTDYLGSRELPKEKIRLKRGDWGDVVDYQSVDIVNYLPVGAKAANKKTKESILYCKLFALKTKPIFEKYVFDFQPSRITYFLRIEMYLEPIKLMLLYKSQLVWFRYLYILFSNYTTYNDFKLVE